MNATSTFVPKLTSILVEWRTYRTEARYDGVGIKANTVQTARSPRCTSAFWRVTPCEDGSAISTHLLRRSPDRGTYTGRGGWRRGGWRSGLRAGPATNRANAFDKNLEGVIAVSNFHGDFTTRRGYRHGTRQPSARQVAACVVCATR